MDTVYEWASFVLTTLFAITGSLIDVFVYTQKVAKLDPSSFRSTMRLRATAVGILTLIVMAPSLTGLFVVMDTPVRNPFVYWPIVVIAPVVALLYVVYVVKYGKAKYEQESRRYRHRTSWVPGPR